MGQDGQCDGEVEGFREALKRRSDSTGGWICCGDGVREVPSYPHWPLSEWWHLELTWGVEGAGGME